MMPLSDSPLSRSLASLSRFFVGDGTFEETLTRVVDLAVEGVPGADLAGITMLVDGRAVTAVFSDAEMVEIDRAQYATGDGPCLDAYRTQAVKSIESTAATGPWPAFRKSASSHGIGSTLSFPLVIDKESVGALNLYSHREDGFPAESRSPAELFASQAAIVLANAQAYWDARLLSARLGEAIASRSVIEQAKGMLMAAQGCHEDVAFELLVKASQRENEKLRTIAQRLVDDAVNRRILDDTDDGLAG
jgi:GAF domain-containing protein